MKTQLTMLMLAATVSLCAAAGSGDSNAAGAKDSARDVITVIQKQGILFDQAEESIFEDEPSPKAVPAKPQTRDSAGNDRGASPAMPDSMPDPQAGQLQTAPPAASSPTSGSLGETAAAPSAPPATVEAVRSVNFARNLKDYRSPKVAMLLSLLLPGSGQAYAESYPWAAVFGAIEAGLVASSIAFNVRGRQERQRAERFANEHYDVNRWSAYYDSLAGFFRRWLGDTLGLDPSVIEDSVRARLAEMYYATEGEDPVGSFRTQATSRTRDYYDAIGTGSMLYVQGWKDCQPEAGLVMRAGPGQTVYDSLGNHYTTHSVPDSAYLVVAGDSAPGPNHPDLRAVFGYSAYQGTYSNMVSAANRYFSNSTTMLFVLLLNHVASAIDAGILAKRHNDRLLGKMTFWERIRIEQHAVNTGNDLVPGYALQVKF